MDKIPMQSSSGDLGARASEKALMKTSAGKSPSMKAAFNGHEPDLGRATSYMKSRKGTMMNGDCA